SCRPMRRCMCWRRVVTAAAGWWMACIPASRRSRPCSRTSKRVAGNCGCIAATTIAWSIRNTRRCSTRKMRARVCRACCSPWRCRKRRHRWNCIASYWPQPRSGRTRCAGCAWPRPAIRTRARIWTQWSATGC
ncbi:hypothetical protein XPN_1680, partial [Xanthomonas arboricola pv. pruni MAFF 301427]